MELFAAFGVAANDGTRNQEPGNRKITKQEPKKKIDVPAR